MGQGSQGGLPGGGKMSMEWGGAGVVERWGISARAEMWGTCLLTLADNQWPPEDAPTTATSPPPARVGGGSSRAFPGSRWL